MSTPSETTSLLDAPSFAVPRLRTARLLLREPQVADFEPFAANLADPLARVHVGGAFDRREAWRRFLAMAGNWVVQGLGWWMVDAADHGPIGAVGVFRRETGPELEIGWSIDRPHWGNGYAPEAARAALQFATALPAGDRIIAYIAPQNTQSATVAAKIGMVREGEASFYGEPSSLYVFRR
jgi:RimJ/RimL family protein N-acetyltransferase